MSGRRGGVGAWAARAWWGQPGGSPRARPQAGAQHGAATRSGARAARADLQKKRVWPLMFFLMYFLYANKV